jgi:hypothetical protein
VCIVIFYTILLVLQYQIKIFVIFLSPFGFSIRKHHSKVKKTLVMSSERWASLKFWMKSFCQNAYMSVVVCVRSDMNICATRTHTHLWRGCSNLAAVQWYCWIYELNFKTVGYIKGYMYLWGSWGRNFLRKIKWKHSHNRGMFFLNYSTPSSCLSLT